MKDSISAARLRPHKFGGARRAAKGVLMQKFKTYQLAVEFYGRTSKLSAPAHLRDQLARASSSIALNTAEGAGRWDAPTDRRRFFRMALGSLRESVAILDLLGNKEPRIRQLADFLGAMLYTLSRP